MLSPDRQKRIVRTLIQAAIAALVMILGRVTNVLAEGTEVWVPIAQAVITALVSTLHNLVDGVSEPR